MNRDSPDELGSGANCNDFLDCLEVPTAIATRSVVDLCGDGSPRTTRLPTLRSQQLYSSKFSPGLARPQFSASESDVDSKTEQIRAAWAAGDKVGALRIAARFFDRSIDTRTFMRGIFHVLVL